MRERWSWLAALRRLSVVRLGEEKKDSLVTHGKGVLLSVTTLQETD